MPTSDDSAPESPEPDLNDAVATSSDAAQSSSWFRLLGDALAGVQHDYTRGSLPRAISLLAVPMVLEMVMESTFAIVDVYCVSQLGDDAVATIGLTESVLTLVFAFAIGFAMATTALVARRVGEKNYEGARSGAKQAMLLGAIFGLVTGVPAVVFGPEILALMGASDGVLETGTGYTRVLLGSNIVVVLLFIGNAIFRGAGDPFTAMKALWLANGINIVLDPCFIFGWGPFPELGVTGAAVASTIGRGSGVVFLFLTLQKGRGHLRLRGRWRVEPNVMRELVRLSYGGVSQFLIATASWVVLMKMVSPFGSTVVAGYTIAIRIVVFAFLPSWGLSNAAATLVGQNLGAKQPDRAERSVWITGWWNMVFLSVVTIVFEVWAPLLIGFFAESEATAEAGVVALRILASGFVFYSWGLVLIQAFNGAGDTATPTRINLVCFWCAQIPSAYILSQHAGWGPQGVYWAVPGAEAILTVIAFQIFRRGRWKETQVGGTETNGEEGDVAAERS